jgi:hypothetical protein
VLDVIGEPYSVLNTLSECVKAGQGCFSI